MDNKSYLDSIKKHIEILKDIRDCKGGDAYITSEDAQALDVAIKYLGGLYKLAVLLSDDSKEV